MQQALHIFLKDTRRFRHLILLLQSWTCVFAYAAVQESAFWNLPVGYDWSGSVVRTASVLYPLAWWLLISEVVRSESLVGDRQFWLTRPYGRGQLVGAKALFVLAYLVAPLLVAQALIIAFLGLPLLPALPALAWNGVLLVAVYVLPAAAVAAVTSSLVQFVMAMAVALAVMMFGVLRPLTQWAGFWWIPVLLALLVLLTAVVSALAVQYRSRRSLAARMLVYTGTFGAILIVHGVPWITAFRVQAMVPNPWSGRMTAALMPPAEAPEGFVRAGGPMWIGYVLSGVDALSPIACEAATVTIEGRDGHTWTSGRVTDTARRVTTDGAGCFFTLRPSESFKELVGNSPVTVRATLHATVFRSSRTLVPVDQPPVRIPRVGICRATNPPTPPRAMPVTWAACDNAFAPPAGVISEGLSGGINASAAESYAPLPLLPQIMPVRRIQRMLGRTGTVAVDDWEPIAHLTVEAEPATLADINGLNPIVRGNE